MRKTLAIMVALLLVASVASAAKIKTMDEARPEMVTLVLHYNVDHEGVGIVPVCATLTVEGGAFDKATGDREGTIRDSWDYTDDMGGSMKAKVKVLIKDLSSALSAVIEETGSTDLP